MRTVLAAALAVAVGVITAVVIYVVLKGDTHAVLKKAGGPAAGTTATTTPSSRTTTTATTHAVGSALPYTPTRSVPPLSAIAVPDVLEDTTAQATAELKSHRLVASAFPSPCTPTRPYPTSETNWVWTSEAQSYAEPIVAQTPRPGTYVNAGTIVEVFVFSCG